MPAIWGLLKTIMEMLIMFTSRYLIGLVTANKRSSMIPEKVFLISFCCTAPQNSSVTRESDMEWLISQKPRHGSGIIPEKVSSIWLSPVLQNTDRFSNIILFCWQHAQPSLQKAKNLPRKMYQGRQKRKALMMFHTLQPTGLKSMLLHILCMMCMLRQAIMITIITDIINKSNHHQKGIDLACMLG